MLQSVQMSLRVLSTILQPGPRCSLKQDYSLPQVALQGLDTVHVADYCCHILYSLDLFSTMIVPKLSIDSAFKHGRLDLLYL